jgi:hypothetical protein
MINVESSNTVRVEKQAQDRSLSSEKRVNINAKGVKFQVPLEALSYVPNSRLAQIKDFIENRLRSDGTFLKIQDICDGHYDELNEFYFNKDPDMVQLILRFYENEPPNNRTHMSGKRFCSLELDAAFTYWKIDYEIYLDECCLIKFEEDKEREIEAIQIERNIITKYTFKKKFGTRFFPHIREKVHNFMEVNIAGFNNLILYLENLALTTV